jgi:hypothetical protein
VHEGAISFALRKKTSPRFSFSEPRRYLTRLET